jgi:hypothetical protein
MIIELKLEASSITTYSVHIYNLFKKMTFLVFISDYLLLQLYMLSTEILLRNGHEDKQQIIAYNMKQNK